MRGAKIFLLTASLLAFAAGAFACEKVDKGKTVNPALKTQFILNEEPKPQRILKADMGGEIEVIGYDVNPTTPAKNQNMQITLYYRVLKTPSKEWQFFGHVECPEPPYRFRLDHSPLGGNYPVKQWQKGELLRDVFTIKVPADFPANSADVYLGFFVDEPGKTDLDNRLKPMDASKADDKFRLKGGILKIEGGEPPKPKEYAAAKVRKGAIKIDGKADEEEWKNAASTGLFVDNYGSKGEPAAEAKVIWDEENLYVFFSVKTKDVSTSFTKNDEPLYKEDVVEVMIDADDNMKDYFEVQVAPNGLIFDKYFHGGPRQGEDMAWESGMKAKAVVEGTLNKNGDADEGWSAELAIPFSKVVTAGKTAPNVPPKDGDRWRANLFAVDLSKDNKWRGTMFNPVYAGDYHALRNWGYIKFVEKPVEKK